MFTVTSKHFTYEPAAGGLGSAPTYLVTPRNKDGMCIELFYVSQHFPKRDELGHVPITGAWKLTEYDRNDDAMDEYWFKNFADADKHAFTLLEEGYDHDELMAGG